MVEDLTARTFSGVSEDAFRIHRGASETLGVDLVSVSGPDEGSSGRPFSIVFRGPTGIPLPQRTYRVEHSEIGSFRLFLVPIGPDEEGLLYEAVFN